MPSAGPSPVMGISRGTLLAVIVAPAAPAAVTLQLAVITLPHVTVPGATLMLTFRFMLLGHMAVAAVMAAVVLTLVPCCSGRGLWRLLVRLLGALAWPALAPRVTTAVAAAGVTAATAAAVTAAAGGPAGAACA